MSNTDSHVRHSSDSTVKVTRGHSCLACYQRKVRCDGKRPCSTCAKNGTECRPATRQAKALRSREAPNATDHDRLLTHLRRCEELLVAHGIDVETHQRTSGDDVSMRESLSPGVEDDDGHMIVQHGHTRFVENALWKGLGNEVNTLLSFHFSVVRPERHVPTRTSVPLPVFICSIQCPLGEYCRAISSSRRHSLSLGFWSVDLAGCSFIYLCTFEVFIIPRIYAAIQLHSFTDEPR